ncbi:MAG: CBS domain-containing protein [Pseudomonadota bacterium]
MLTVAEIMTREPYTLHPDQYLGDARRLMAEHHIRHIPIVSKDGTLIGVVSQRDVLAASQSRLAGSDTGGDATLALAEVMSSPVHTTDPDAGLRGAALFLQQNRLGCLPVLASGKLVGIVTDSDYVTVAVHLMEQIELAEPVEDDGIYADDEPLP